ncbi:MAG: hypothetical protein AAF721_12965 [Myxococcota bacterium]
MVVVPRFAVCAWVAGLVVGCSRGPGSSAAAIPLRDALVGEWRLRCKTRDESRARCLGATPTRKRLRFRATGEIVSTHDEQDPLEGAWVLDGSVLTMSFDVAGIHVDDVSRARVDDGRLVLWSLTRASGSIYARPDAEFEPPPSRQTTTAPTIGTLEGVRYSLQIPPGYRLARDDAKRQRWDPIDGEGLLYEVRTSPRAQTERDGAWVTEPCEPETRPLPLGSTARGGSGKPDRLVAITTSLCVPGTSLSLGCRAKHRRGHIEAAEQAAAEAVCLTLTRVP